MADNLIDPDNLPLDYNLGLLDNPEELAKFARKPCSGFHAVHSSNEDLSGYGDFDDPDTRAEMEMDGFGYEEVNEHMECALDGLLRQKVNGIAINTTEGIPWLFQQLHERLLKSITTHLRGHAKDITDLRIDKIDAWGFELHYSYTETDEQLKERIRTKVHNKVRTKRRLETQRKQALKELEEAGFELQPDGSLKELKPKKSKKSKK